MKIVDSASQVKPTWSDKEKILLEDVALDLAVAACGAGFRDANDVVAMVGKKLANQKMALQAAALDKANDQLREEIQDHQDARDSLTEQLRMVEEAQYQLSKAINPTRVVRVSPTGRMTVSILT